MSETHYSVLRTTTDKMQRDMDQMSEDDGWELFQATHVGGRDWVLIYKDDHELSDEDDWATTAEVAARLKRAAGENAPLYGGER